MSEQKIHEEEKERKKQQLRAKGTQIASSFVLDFRSKTKKVRDYAEEWKGLVPDEQICSEVVKAMNKAIQLKAISIHTIRDALPPHYKLNYAKRYENNAWKGHAKQSEKDVLNLAIAIIEKVSGYDYKDVRKMSREDFLSKYRHYFVMDLKSWIDHDVHQLALILNYLFPMVRDMIERIEEERAILRKKAKTGIGDV